MDKKYKEIYLGLIYRVLGYFTGLAVIVFFLDVGTSAWAYSSAIYTVFTSLMVGQGPNAFGDKYYYGPLSFIIVMFSPIACIIKRFTLHS